MFHSLEFFLFIWLQRRGKGRGWGWGGATMSNPSPMSQAMSHGDTKWKTLRRVEVSRAQWATVSHWPQENWRWRLKKPTRKEEQSWKETKAESTLPPYGRQAGSLVQVFDRKIAKSHPRKWLPESCPMLARKGNCVVSGNLPGQLS